VIRLLGFGTFSTVWLCWDLNRGRLVAVKVMNSEDDNAYNHEKAVLDHVKNFGLDDKVVTSLEWFFLDGSNGRHICATFEVMGPSLFHRLNQCHDSQKHIPLHEVKILVSEILQILHELHTRCNIIHGDLKPDNILQNCDTSYVNRLVQEAMKLPCHEKLLKRLKSSKSVLFISKKMEAFYQMKSKGTLDVEQLCVSNDVWWPPDDNRPITNSNRSSTVNNLVKISDLGGASFISVSNNDPIQARAYRAFEVVMKMNYSSPVDIWSVGCIAFELATNEVLFDVDPLKDEIAESQQHLERMLQFLGPVPDYMISSNFDLFQTFFNEKGRLHHKKKVPYVGMCRRLKKARQWQVGEVEHFCEFLLSMLTFDPRKRLTAFQCLKHDWFKEIDSVYDKSKKPPTTTTV
jgi:hypothetical protein